MDTVVPACFDVFVVDPFGGVVVVVVVGVVVVVVVVVEVVVEVVEPCPVAPAAPWMPVSDMMLKVASAAAGRMQWTARLRRFARLPRGVPRKQLWSPILAKL